MGNSAAAWRALPFVPPPTILCPSAAAYNGKPRRGIGEPVSLFNGRSCIITNSRSGDSRIDEDNDPTHDSKRNLTHRNGSKRKRCVVLCTAHILWPTHRSIVRTWKRRSSGESEGSGHNPASRYGLCILIGPHSHV